MTLNDDLHKPINCPRCGRIIKNYQYPNDCPDCKRNDAQKQREKNTKPATTKRGQASNSQRSPKSNSRTEMPKAPTSFKAGLAGFVAGLLIFGGYMGASAGITVVGSLASAAIFAKFYQQIIGLGVVAFLVFVFSKSWTRDQLQSGENKTKSPSAANEGSTEIMPIISKSDTLDYPTISTAGKRDTTSNAFTNYAPRGVGRSNSFVEKELTEAQLAARKIDKLREIYPEPPNIVGRLFKDQDQFDLIVSKEEKTAYIFHQIPLQYNDISHFVYHSSDHWVTVVMMDGKRLGLGEPIEWFVRPWFSNAKVINIVRTKRGEAVDGVWRELRIVDGDDAGFRYRIGAGIRPKGVKSLVVTSVTDGAPASVCGLKAGDEILSVSNVNVSSTSEFIEKIQESNGLRTKLRIIRNGAKIDLYVFPTKT